MRRIAFAAVLAAAACARPVPDGALAVYDGGEVTREELDGRILGLPEEARRPEDGDFEAWYERLLKEAAVDEILLAEAGREALEEDEELTRTWEEVSRQIAASAYVRREEGSATVSQEEIRAYFEEHRDQFHQEARREVQHLYLRRREGEDDPALRQRMSALRRRVLAGESFEAVARRYSDSESRHRGGSLGWVTPDQLDPAVEAIVFSLPEGELGEPVLVGGGAHLFLVRQAVEERDYDLEEVRRAAWMRTRQAKTAEVVARLAASQERPEGSFVPTEDELRTLLGQGNEGDLVLRVGEVAWTVGDIRRQLRSQPPEAQQTPLQIVRSLEWQVLLARAARAEGLLDTPEIRQRLEAARKSLLLEAHRRRRLLERALADDEALRRHYGTNARRFATPLRLQLRVLTLSVGEDPDAAMASLEEAVAGLDSGEETLDGLAERLGGTVREVGWVSMQGLRETAGKVAQMVTQVRSGGHSAPYRSGRALELVEVVDRREPEERPFEAVREAVAEHRIETAGRELHSEMVEELLAASGFRVLQDRLALLDGVSR